MNEQEIETFAVRVGEVFGTASGWVSGTREGIIKQELVGMPAPDITQALLAMLIVRIDDAMSKLQEANGSPRSRVL